MHAIVKLSKRRNPALHLLDESEGQLADVILIDALDKNATSWAEAQPWLVDKPVGWVDTPRDVPTGHSKLNRPVQWPILPMLLSRILFKAGDSNGAKQDSETTPSASDTASETVAPTAESMQGKRVLVVDDSLAVRQQLKIFLEKSGLVVSFAENGEAAITSCRTASYDCILLDVLMPGIDGYETCRRIKALPQKMQETRIIMLTSRTSPFDRIRGKMAGCDAYLTKPVLPQKLHEVLSQYLLS
ncbi:MAG: response regulator [bacterium]|nr:response regulator [bacterium]